MVGYTNHSKQCHSKRSYCLSYPVPDSKVRDLCEYTDLDWRIKRSPFIITLRFIVESPSESEKQFSSLKFIPINDHDYCW